eukprot:TRINITY_DN1143_c0_g1_i4.p1 TRINITY_DN1143_c0_g1~~TRINITY_DN1143_c0_g1_i4.p1  ORF type:complete len:114 (-),score=9.80 TRINITY_DN1143_c0_g1_i4:42-383(-)
MGRVYKSYLSNPKIYVCKNCRSHLTSRDQIFSKDFVGKFGPAYLFTSCINMTIGPSEDRVLKTGLHTVADIYCVDCNDLIGWTYEAAYVDDQKYKIGKYILEKEKITKIRLPY